MKKTKVGLAQINNSFSGQNYLPYSVGLLQAYAQKYLKVPSAYEFMLPIYLREAVEVSMRKLEEPNAGSGSLGLYARIPKGSPTDVTMTSSGRRTNRASSIRALAALR